MSKNIVTMDNCLELWNKKIYDALKGVLLEQELPSWGFFKNISQAKKYRKQGIGPKFLQLENGAIIYCKGCLIEWHLSQPEAKRSTLNFPKEKKLPEVVPEQMEFDFG